MTTTRRTRGSGRMYPQSGPTMPNATRSAADAPATLRTAPIPTPLRGKGVHASAIDPHTTSSGSYSSLPGEGTPSRVRARGEAARG